MSDREVRSIVTEVRALEDGTGKWITGYGLVFNEWSQDLGGFRERINPAATAGDVISVDMVVCGNHDPNNVLGRVSAGSVVVTVDSRGVLYRALVNEADPMAVAFYERVKRGDIAGSSFSFWIEKDRWYVEGGETRREILAFKAIDEMGPVTFPAYLQTSAEARNRALTFDESLVDADAHRAASWTRFYQLQAALETTILDCLYAGSDEAGASAAIDDFAASLQTWLTDHMARFASWYPDAALGVDEVRARLIAEVERRTAIITDPHVEQRLAADEDLHDAEEVVAHDEPASIPTYPLIPRKD